MTEAQPVGLILIKGREVYGPDYLGRNLLLDNDGMLVIKGTFG